MFTSSVGHNWNRMAPVNQLQYALYVQKAFAHFLLPKKFNI